MSKMIIDRLFKEVQEKGPVCIGLDTSVSYLSPSMQKISRLSEKIFTFNKEVIDASFDICAVYKLQIAYYEALGIEGLKAYAQTLEYLRNRNILTIADVKRGDIKDTAKMYAKAHFEGEFESDFITISPYMGFDSIEPYLKYLSDNEKGLFVLLRTSNEGAKDIEYKETDGKRIYDIVGEELLRLGKSFMGECSYSSLGAVVGDNRLDIGEADDIRKRYENIFFLIPGYGAQGGNAKSVMSLLKDMNGGVVNSSRGIIKYPQKFEDWDDKFQYYIRESVVKMREDFGLGKSV